MSYKKNLPNPSKTHMSNEQSPATAHKPQNSQPYLWSRVIPSCNSSLSPNSALASKSRDPGDIGLSNDATDRSMLCNVAFRVVVEVQAEYVRMGIDLRFFKC